MIGQHWYISLAERFIGDWKVFVFSLLLLLFKRANLSVCLCHLNQRALYPTNSSQTASAQGSLFCSREIPGLSSALLPTTCIYSSMHEDRLNRLSSRGNPPFSCIFCQEERRLSSLLWSTLVALTFGKESQLKSTFSPCRINRILMLRWTGFLIAFGEHRQTHSKRVILAGEIQQFNTPLYNHACNLHFSQGAHPFLPFWFSSYLFLSLFYIVLGP